MGVGESAITKRAYEEEEHGDPALQWVGESAITKREINGMNAVWRSPPTKRWGTETPPYNGCGGSESRIFTDDAEGAEKSWGIVCSCLGGRVWFLWEGFSNPMSPFVSGLQSPPICLNQDSPNQEINGMNVF